MGARCCFIALTQSLHQPLAADTPLITIRTIQTNKRLKLNNSREATQLKGREVRCAQQSAHTIWTLTDYADGFNLSFQGLPFSNPVLFRVNSYYDPFWVCLVIHEDSHCIPGSLKPLTDTELARNLSCCFQSRSTKAIQLLCKEKNLLTFCLWLPVSHTEESW